MIKCNSSVSIKWSTPSPPLDLIFPISSPPSDHTSFFFFSFLLLFFFPQFFNLNFSNNPNQQNQQQQLQILDHSLSLTCDDVIVVTNLISLEHS
ncbi:hypothetical protein P8452_63300 [Trifolium repens]|nr:hypothetical protein P8452_63300 [Trifolium repens]